MKLYGIALGLIIGFAPYAWAGNVAHCEVLLIQTVEDDDLEGAVQITAYRPAASFIASVHDDDPDHETQVDGHPIKALLCRRNDVIPADSDYPMIATGVPIVLSQDFDSPTTDSLTVYWKEGAFDYVYKGYPLSDEAQVILDNRLERFTKRGLYKTVKTKAPEDAEPTEDTGPTEDTNPETPDSNVTETDGETETETPENIEEKIEE